MYTLYKKYVAFDLNIWPFHLKINERPLLDIANLIFSD